MGYTIDQEVENAPYVDSEVRADIDAPRETKTELLTEAAKDSVVKEQAAKALKAQEEAVCDKKDKICQTGKYSKK